MPKGMGGFQKALRKVVGRCGYICRSRIKTLLDTRKIKELKIAELIIKKNDLLDFIRRERLGLKIIMSP